MQSKSLISISISILSIICDRCRFTIEGRVENGVYKNFTTDRSHYTELLQLERIYYFIIITIIIIIIIIMLLIYRSIDLRKIITISSLCSCDKLSFSPFSIFGSPLQLPVYSPVSQITKELCYSYSYSFHIRHCPSMAS